MATSEVTLRITQQLNWQLFQLLQKLAGVVEPVEEETDKGAYKKKSIEKIKEVLEVEEAVTEVHLVLDVTTKGLYIIPNKVAKEASQPVTEYRKLAGSAAAGEIQIYKTGVTIEFDNQDTSNFFNNVFVDKSIDYKPTIGLLTQEVKRFKKMAEQQKDGPEPANSTGSEKLEIKMEDWGTQDEQMVNQVSEEKSSIKRSKLRQPKYDETQGPIEPWLDREARLIEMSGTRSEKETAVILLGGLPDELLTNVMAQFKSKKIDAPDVTDLKKALAETSKRSSADWNTEMRSLRWDSAQWKSMSAYFERLKALTRLSLGGQVEEHILTRITSNQFREGMPDYIKKSDIFELTDVDGVKLIALAQKLLNKREKQLIEVNTVTHTQPARQDWKVNCSIVKIERSIVNVRLLLL